MSMSKTLSYGVDILFIIFAAYPVLLLFRYIFKKKKKNSFVSGWIGSIYGMAI